MGNLYSYHCERCGFEKNFYHGHGYLIHSQSLNDYFKQRTVLFHYKVHKMLRNFEKSCKELFIKSGFQVYKCPTCKVLFDKVEVVVYDHEKVVHKSEFRCTECRTRLKLTNIHRLKKAVCPRCHEKAFQHHSLQKVLWD
jgi:predicted RNA-binding Zn-ribbon protein involved in translation (DUF1610 family)